MFYIRFALFCPMDRFAKIKAKIRVGDCVRQTKGLESMKTMTLVCWAAVFAGHVFGATDADRGDRAILFGGQVGTLRFDAESKGAVKAGATDTTVPLSGVKGAGTLSVCATEGGIAFSGEASTDESVPAALVEQAALWLKSDVNVDCASGSSVATWYDCRETCESGVYGNTHLRADSREGTTGEPTTVWPTKTTDGIDFGTYGSGRWMRFQNAVGEDVDIEKVHHAFVVYSIDTAKGLGFVLGVKKGAQPYFHRGNGVYLSEQSAPLVARAGQFRLDGVRIDPIVTPVQTGRHLLSYEAGGMPKVHVEALFFDREVNDKERCGGGVLAEVVLFTNRLHSAERLAVENYLAVKYGLAADRTAVPLVNVRSTDDGSVKVSSATAQAFSPTNGVTIAGAGRIDVADGALTLSSRNAADFEGSVRYASVGTFVGGPVPYGVEAGKAVDLAPGDHGIVSVTPSSAPAGSFVKTGGADMAIREIPSDVTRLEFSGGTLHLLGRQADVAPAVAVFANPGFELNNASTGDLRITSPRNAPIADQVPGWTLQLNDAAVNSAFWHFTNVGMKSRTWFSPYEPPEGDYALGFQASGDIWTTVKVPQAGVYELTFKTCARTSYTGARLAVSLDGNVFAHVTAMDGSGFVINRLRTPLLSADDHVLKLACTTTFDSTVIFDDFKMVRVADALGGDGVWQIPNGSFEDVTYSKGNDVKTVNGGVVANWTLAGETASSDSYVVCRSNPDNLFCEAKSSGGNQHLVLFGDGSGASGQAFSTASIGLVPGSYRLRVKAAFWGGSGSWLKGVDWSGTWSRPKLVGTVSVNGVAVSCGSADVGQSYFDTVTFPETVDIPVGATVAVSIGNLRGDGKASGIAVDDVELVSVENDIAIGEKEYVTNGGFEGNSVNGWTKVGTGDVRGPTHTTYNIPYPYASGYGNAYCFRILQDCLLWQNIVFDRAGVYRLKFAANGRNQIDYSGNALRVWLVAEGSSKTNVVCETASIYTHEFSQFEYMFRIVEPGTYKFGVQGVNGLDGRQVGKKANDATCHVDDISVRYVGDWTFAAAEKGPELVLSDDAALRLDFTGTNVVQSLKIGTKKFHGVVDASSDARIAGVGALYVPPRGVVLIFR